jgi:CRP-like cAMP-binding protein
MYSLKAIDQNEWSAIIADAVGLRLKKGALIFRKGDRCDKEVFLEEGIVRGFLIDEDGNEKSTAFFQQGEFVSMLALRTQNGLSLYNYEALTPVKLLLFDSKLLKRSLSESKKRIALGKEIKERESRRLLDRDDCLLQVKAADKYRKFVGYYPSLESRISQRYIASYLGITPVSLSRVKKSLNTRTINN